MRHLRATCALVLSGALAACASGGNGSLPPIGAHGASTAASPAHKHKVKVTLRIVIPKKKRHRNAPVRAHYVSPSTQSIAIAITPSSGPEIDYDANLTPASNENCTAAIISPLVCTIAFELAPGNYTATFATYDGLLQSGAPTGNLLSSNQSVPLHVVTGKDNAIGVSLYGIPTGVLLVPHPSAGMSGSMAGGFSLSKCSTGAKVSVLGTDADENVIVGPGAPTPELVSADTSQIAVSTPAPKAPNAFTISHPANALADPFPIQLTAKVTPNAGSGQSMVNAKVNVSVNGDICGTFTEFAIPTSNSHPYGIATGPDSAMWFTEVLGNQVGRISTDAAVDSPGIVEYPLATGIGPEGITTGPDGNLWFAETASSQIGKMTTDGTLTEFSQGITSSTSPNSIVTGPDGALWFSEAFGGIGRITTDATVNNTGVVEYSANAGNTPGLNDITSGPGNQLWFTICTISKIGRVTTDGSMGSQQPTFTGSASPFGIAAGNDGALWYTELANNKVGRLTTNGIGSADYAIPTPNSFVEYIVNGPDGALWFTENQGNKIGRITTAGVITEFTIPTANSGPVGLTLGPDGAIWFAESAANKIGRLK